MHRVSDQTAWFPVVGWGGLGRDPVGFPTTVPVLGVCGVGVRVTVVIAWGKRPVPFRTRKLRLTAPMVLQPGGCGRVGHRRTIINGVVPHQPLSPVPPFFCGGLGCGCAGWDHTHLTPSHGNGSGDPSKLAAFLFLRISTGFRLSCALEYLYV